MTKEEQGKKGGEGEGAALPAMKRGRRKKRVRKPSWSPIFSLKKEREEGGRGGKGPSLLREICVAGVVEGEKEEDRPKKRVRPGSTERGRGKGEERGGLCGSGRAERDLHTDYCRRELSGKRSGSRGKMEKA